MSRADIGRMIQGPQSLNEMILALELIGATISHRHGTGPVYRNGDFILTRDLQHPKLPQFPLRGTLARAPEEGAK